MSAFTTTSTQVIIPIRLEPLQEVTIQVESSIQEKIVNFAKEYGADPFLSLAVAHAESCFDPLAKNPKSSASGIFQFIKQTFKDYCSGDVFNEDDNIKCATKLLAEKDGIKHWEASRKEGCGGGWESHIKTYKAKLET